MYKQTTNIGTDNSSFISVEQMRQLLGISRVLAYQLIHAEGFPKIVIGQKRIIINKDELLQWLKNKSN